MSMISRATSFLRVTDTKINHTSELRVRRAHGTLSPHLFNQWRFVAQPSPGGAGSAGAGRRSTRGRQMCTGTCSRSASRRGNSSAHISHLNGPPGAVSASLASLASACCMARRSSAGRPPACGSCAAAARPPRAAACAERGTRATAGRGARGTSPEGRRRARRATATETLAVGMASYVPNREGSVIVLSLIFAASYISVGPSVVASWARCLRRSVVWDVARAPRWSVEYVHILRNNTRDHR